MAVISMKQLLEAGVISATRQEDGDQDGAVHLPTERNGIYIIDLQRQ